MAIRELCPYCQTNPYSEKMFGGFPDNLTDTISSCDECNFTFESSQNWEFANGVKAPVDGVATNPIQAWYLEQQSKDNNKLQFWHFTDPSGMFNVEGGTVTFSSLQQRDCCELSGAYDGNCDECGNGQGKSLTMLAGGGDGVYAVWQDAEEIASNLLISFAPYRNEVPTINGAKEYMADSVPLYLGSINSDGALYIRENYQGQVSILVQPGTYDIVAWIGTSIRMGSYFDSASLEGEEEKDLLHLQSVGVSIHLAGTTPYKSSTTEILQALNFTTKRVQGALWGSGHLSVQSHMQPATEFVNFFSYQFIGLEKFLARERATGELYYHLLTIGLEVLGEQARAELEMLQNGNSEEIFHSALLLMRVGREQAAIAQMSIAAERGSSLAQVYLDRWTQDRDRDLFPIWGVLSGFTALERAEDLENTNPEVAMNYYVMAASRGISAGLLGFVRGALLTGQYNQAIASYPELKKFVLTNFENVYYDLSETNQLEVAKNIEGIFRADNTIAVCLVYERNTDLALRIWDETIEFYKENSEYPRLEALIFRAVMNQRIQVQIAAELIQEFSADSIETVRQDLEQLKNHASTASASWSVLWFEECLSVLARN